MLIHIKCKVFTDGDRIEIKEEKWEYDDLPKCYDDFFKFLFNLQ